MEPGMHPSGNPNILWSGVEELVQTAPPPTAPPERRSLRERLKPKARQTQQREVPLVPLADAHAAISGAQAAIDQALADITEAGDTLAAVRAEAEEMTATLEADMIRAAREGRDIPEQELLSRRASLH